ENIQNISGAAHPSDLLTGTEEIDVSQHFSPPSAVQSDMSAADPFDLFKHAESANTPQILDHTLDSQNMSGTDTSKLFESSESVDASLFFVSSSEPNSTFFSVLANAGSAETTMPHIGTSLINYPLHDD